MECNNRTYYEHIPVEFSTLLWWVLPTSVRQDCPHKMAAQANTVHNMRLIVSGSNASCLQSKLYKHVFNSASLAFWIRLCNRLAPTSDVKRNDIVLAWHAVEHMLDTRYVTISGYRGTTLVIPERASWTHFIIVLAESSAQLLHSIHLLWSSIGKLHIYQHVTPTH